MAVQTLARGLLSGRCAAVALVRPLHPHLRYGRDQQQLLPTPGAGHLREVASAGTAALCLRGQGESLSDAYEEAEGSRTAVVPLLRKRSRARFPTGARAVSASAPVADRPRALRTL